MVNWYADIRGRQISVVHIKDPKKQRDLLLAALQIYEDRIPDNEKDGPEDIIRWIEEVKQETSHGNCKLMDYFLVAKVANHVAGFAYAHLYPSAQMAFFSYLVVKRPVKDHNRLPNILPSEERVSVKLLDTLAAELRRTGICKAIVVELEEPDTITDRRRKLKAAARIRHLKSLAGTQGVFLRSVDIPYKQPRLRLDDPEATEERLRLMIAFVRPPEQRREITRDDIAEVLAFLADCIYGDQFEDDPRLYERYHAYLRQWQADQMRTVPKVVRLK